jgi:DNA-binding beta-propeller fold protein YncE
LPADTCFFIIIMKKITLLPICFAFFLLRVSAQNYVAEKTIAIPGNGGYDYAFIDQANHHLYTSHGTAVNVIDLQTEKVIGTISGMKGVHGIAIANDLGRGFISDGRGNAVVAFDINTLQVIKTIPVTGKGPDGIIYDPFSKKIFAFEGDSNSAVVIDPQDLSQTTAIDLGGAPEFAVADGDGLIYNNLEDKSSLDVIDTKSFKVIHTYPLDPCGGPTGLALDKANNRLFTVCRQNKGMSVIDATSGKVIQTLAIGAGVDAVIYDAADKLVIASNGDGTATIFKQTTPDSYELVQTLKTQFKAKTMAMDGSTHKLYFPVADFQPGTKTQVPDSFKVLVYTLK